MAQGWSSPSSSTKSERSAIRADFPARERDTSAWVPCQIHSPAWSGLAELEQQHHPEHTEELSVRYASTPASSLSFLFWCLCHVVLAHCQPDTPSHSGPSYYKDTMMYMLSWRSVLAECLLTVVKALGSGLTMSLLPSLHMCVCLYFLSKRFVYVFAWCCPHLPYPLIPTHICSSVLQLIIYYSEWIISGLH